MTLNDVVFINNLPTVDLHGYDRETGRVALCDFLRDQIKLRNKVVVVVHGIGSGVLKQMTDEVLKKHKKVLEYKRYYYNEGCTIVLLEI